MSRLIREAVASEKTVRRAEQAAREVPRMPYTGPVPYRWRKPEYESPVVVTRPHPATWAAALELAGGDWRRLKVISPTNIEILPEP